MAGSARGGTAQPFEARRRAWASRVGLSGEAREAGWRMAEGREAGRAIASRVGPVGDGRRHEAGRSTAGLGRVADARGAWSRARGAGRSIASLGRALAGFRGTEGNEPWRSIAGLGRAAGGLERDRGCATPPSR